MYLWPTAKPRIQCEMRAILLALLLFTGTAQAEVYKCLAQGKFSYTDTPCDAAARPTELPGLTTIPHGRSENLSKAYDQRLSREKAARDKSDAALVKSHAEKAKHDQAVRAAIIDHRVIKGMTAAEVDSAMGAAEQTLDNGGGRRYRRGGQRLVITFKDGVVTQISNKREKNYQ